MEERKSRVTLENKPCFACGYAGHALESLPPGILGPSSPTKLEKNHILK